MRLLTLVVVGSGIIAAENVQIGSQPAIVDLPPAGGQAVPLLVHLHSWSSRFDNSGNLADVRAEAKQRGWAFVSPDFEGVNDHPEACGSELAVQDVLDAVEWAKQRASIDPRRIYLVGSSGGGYMALMMAGRTPGVWAAVSAIVPISDLSAWYAFSKEKDSRYWKMLEGCFGYPPTHGMALQQYRRRSPIHFLRLARGVLPVDIQTGIQDGHTGAVPVSHTLRAFNELAAPGDRIPEADIESITQTAKVPSAMAANVDEPRAKKVLFRRVSGSARVTIFDGGHETDFPPSVRWLEGHRQPDVAIATELQNDQLLPRELPLPAPTTRGPGRLQVRVNGGPWQLAMPKLAAGGPYSIEFSLGSVTVKRTGIMAGDLYLLAGQSNMVGRAPLVDVAPPDPQVRMLTPEDTWAVARDPVHEALLRDGRVIGIGLGLAFAKEMVRRTGVPVGLVPCAVGGTSLAQWSPELRSEQRRSLYGNFLARAKMAGPAKGILWYQGEADASAVDTANSYATRFQALVRTMRADLGQPQLPFYYAQLSRYVIEKGYDGWDTVREAQRLSEAPLQPAGMVATIDQTLTDPIHLDRAGLETVGKRFASRILDGAGPALASATWETPGRLRLKFTKRVAGPRRIHGFDLDRTSVLQATQEAATGDILLSIAPVKGGDERSLYYCRGLNPVCELADSNGQALAAFGPIRLDPAPKMK
jgi:acetyl esterase/lipase